MPREPFSTLKDRVTHAIQKLHEAQKALGPVHIFILLGALFGLAILGTTWLRQWHWPPSLSQIFTCVSISTLIGGFAALFLDVVNRLEKLGYLLLAMSLTCLYWSEQQQERFKIPGELATFVEKYGGLPISVLRALWEQVTSDVSAIREPAVAKARQFLLEKPNSPANAQIAAQIAPILADSLVVAAGKNASQKSNSEEVQKTTTALVKIKEQLPPESKAYVNARIEQAEAKTASEAISPTVATNQPTVQGSTDDTGAAVTKDTQSKELATADAAALSKGKVEGVVEQRIDPATTAASPTPTDGSPVSDEEIGQASDPLNQIVKAANEVAQDTSTGSKAADDAAVVNHAAVETVVPETPSELSERDIAPKPQDGSPSPAATVAAPDPNKVQVAKDKKPLDNAKSLKLEAELLLAIHVIENVANNSPNGEMPYAQLRELRLRLDSKKGGDLRNLAEPSKTRVLKKLDDLDKRLRKGAAKGRAKKNYPEEELLRVGFLFPDEKQRLSVRLAQINLNRNSTTPFYCPAIENVGRKGRIPGATEIRYFEYSIFGWLRPKDAESHASRLAALLQNTIPGIGTVRTVYYQPKRDDERPGNFEVWFSRSAFRE